jgi:hypothetical protein
LSNLGGTPLTFNNVGRFLSGGVSATDQAGISAVFNNSGLVSVETGSLGFGNAVSNTGIFIISKGTAVVANAFVQTSGGTNLTGGALNSSNTIAINGGFLSGVGTINANVYNNGEVNPGGTGAPGILAINGSYTQSGSGVLNIELGGPIAGSQFDQLNVSGSASLGGTLNISLLHNLGDLCGGSFAALNSSPVNGTFSTINGLSQPGGMTITPAYRSSSLTLVASKFAATTGVTASVNPSFLNQGVTFTATVSAPAGTTDAPNGTVQFQVDAVNVGSPVTLSGGQASLSLSSLAVGPQTVTAVYSGDGCFYTGSGSLTHNVRYIFGGFQAPLGQVQSYAINRNVPIKFQLSDFSNTAVTALSAVTGLQIFNSQNVDVLGGTGAAGVSVSGKTYSYAWQTKGLAAGSYTISLTLADGATQTISVQLTKNGNSAGLTTAEAGGTSSAPGGLLGGNVEVYVDNGNGELTADELARIQDAVTAVDTVTEPYGVAVQEVSDPTLADVTLNMDTTSAVGGHADGVIGCTTDAGQITIISGWNFYAGSDASQIGTDQYDFQTVVTHELGHALGLGHSSDSTSVMYATLDAGAVNRNLTTADLDVPDSITSGSCGLHAAARQAAADASPSPIHVAPGGFAWAAGPGSVGGFLPTVGGVGISPGGIPTSPMTGWVTAAIVPWAALISPRDAGARPSWLEAWGPVLKLDEPNGELPWLSPAEPRTADQPESAPVGQDVRPNEGEKAIISGEGGWVWSPESASEGGWMAWSQEQESGEVWGRFVVADDFTPDKAADGSELLAAVETVLGGEESDMVGPERA